MPRAVYDAIYQELKSAIENGEVRHGELLPSESKLVARYGCSRNTVRRALALLADEGYVLAQNGRGVRVVWQAGGDGGTFAADHAELSVFESFKETALREGKRHDNVVLTLEEVLPDADLTRLSGLPAGEPLVHVVELRQMDGRTLYYDEHHLPLDVAEGLTAADVENSIFEYLERRHGIVPVMSKGIVSVDANPPLGASEALGATEGVPLVMLTSQTLSSEGRMVEFTRSYLRLEDFRMAYTVTRKLPLSHP